MNVSKDLNKHAHDRYTTVITMTITVATSKTGRRNACGKPLLPSISHWLSSLFWQWGKGGLQGGSRLSPMEQGKVHVSSIRYRAYLNLHYCTTALPTSPFYSWSPEHSTCNGLCRPYVGLGGRFSACQADRPDPLKVPHSTLSTSSL